MGIPGLLNQLKSLSRQVNLKEYQGMRIGIDIYCWLHRGGYSCCRDLAEGNETNAYVVFCMEILHLMLSLNIKPVVVFDGRPLPAKQLLNNSRKEFREKNKKLAQEAVFIGDDALAYKYYQKSVTITYDMSRNLMKTLKKENIDFLISPYESDAQLAFLSKNNLIDVVVTEDSDSLVYGCRRVLFKLDKEGNGTEINRRNLGLNRDLSFLNWTDDQFKLMCCLAGCDYMPKLRNMGIKTAYKLVSQYSSLDTLLGHLEKSGLTRLYDNFAEAFEKCFLVFKHQTVYNPIKQRLQPLSPFPPFFPDGYLIASTKDDGDTSDPMKYLHFLGPMLPEGGSARAVAEGTVHLFTLQPLHDSLSSAGAASIRYQGTDNDNDDDDDDLASETDDAEKGGGGEGRRETRLVGDAPITFQTEINNNRNSKVGVALASAASRSPVSRVHQRKPTTAAPSTAEGFEEVSIGEAVLQSVLQRPSDSISSHDVPVPVVSPIHRSSNQSHRTTGRSPLRTGSPGRTRDSTTMWAFVCDPKTSTEGLRSAGGGDRGPVTAGPPLTISTNKNRPQHTKRTDRLARAKDDMFESPAVGDGLETLHRRKRRLHQTSGGRSDWETDRVTVTAARTTPTTTGKEGGEAALAVGGADSANDLSPQSASCGDFAESAEAPMQTVDLTTNTTTPRTILRQYLESPPVAESSGWGKSHLLRVSNDLSPPPPPPSASPDWTTRGLGSLRTTGAGAWAVTPSKQSPHCSDVGHTEVDRENTPNLENYDPAVPPSPSMQCDMLSIFPSFSNQVVQIPEYRKYSNNYDDLDDGGADKPSCIPSFRNKLLAAQCREDDLQRHRLPPPPTPSRGRFDSPRRGVLPFPPAAPTHSHSHSHSPRYRSRSPMSLRLDSGDRYNDHHLSSPKVSSFNSRNIGKDLVTFRPHFSSFSTSSSHMSVPDAYQTKRGERYWDLKLS